MLPQFQRLTQDGSGSLSTSASFTCLNPPRYYEDFLSPIDTPRMDVSEDRFAAATASFPPPSSPLVVVSVALSAVPTDESVQCLSEVDKMAKLLCRRFYNRPNPKKAEVKPSVVSPPTSDTSPAEETDEDVDSSAFLDNPVTCNTSVNSSIALSRLAEWGIVWRHIFPQHIAPFLSVRDVLEVSRVCRTSRAGVRQPWVWRSLAACHYAVHPASVERIFQMAVREWAKDGLASGNDMDEGERQLRRLVVHEHRVSTGIPWPRYPSLSLPFSSPHSHEINGEETPTLTTSTATAPWLMNETTETSAPEDAEETSEGEADDPNDTTAEDADEVVIPILTPPPTTSEGVTTLTNAIEREVQESETAVMNVAPSPVASSVANMESIASTTLIFTRAAPPSRSRYLWQATTAAMPSPSSPIPSPHAGDDSEEGDPLGISAMPTTAHTQPPSPQYTGDTEDTAAEETTLNVTATTSSPLSLGVHVSGASMAASACARTSTPVSRSFPIDDAVAATCTDQLTAALPSNSHVTAMSTTELKSGEGKCHVHGGRSAGREEQLPPPSPAQLDCAACRGILFHEGKRVEGSMVPAASSVSPTQHRRPSYTLETAIDAMGASADGSVALPTADAATPSSYPPSPAVVPTYSYTLCRATAERTVFKEKPEFPWHLFTRYLYANRIQLSLSRWRRLCKRAHEELCRGAWDAAYGSLSHVIHALFQKGSCRGVEHLLLLAQTLLRRSSLCRHRGHVHLLAAFTDLCMAALLCPDIVTTSDVMELCAKEEFARQSPEAWMQSYEAAAQTASPVAQLGTLAQVLFLFPQHRTLCFCSALAAYMRAYRAFGHSLNHLLCCAADWATPGTEEELLVRALRETVQAKQRPPCSSSFYVRKACATADYALSLMPLQVRCAVDVLVNAWVRDCFHSEGAVYAADITQWAASAPEMVRYANITTMEVRWLAWLTCEVQTFVFQELTGKLPAKAALTSVVLALTKHDRADGLVRIAAQYANYEIRSEDLFPALPCNSHRRRVTQYLLDSALRLHPLHTTAALLLSRVYAAGGEEAGSEGDMPMSSAVLSDCIHNWAKRFSMLELSGPTTPYLHRRERSPEVCFIPSELLVARNRCLQSVADLAEATEQHQSLSYPYQMRAAMAMDRGYHVAAILEMNRIIKLSLDPNDVALRIRFLQDAVELPLPRSAQRSEARASAFPPSSFDDVFSRGGYFERRLRTPLAASPLSPTAHLTEPPSMENSLQVRLSYRVWLARMSGLLILLRPPEAFVREENESDNAVLSSSFGGGSACSRLLFSPELPSMTTRGFGVGHVSRVASMAFEAEGDVAVPTSADAVNAAHVREFLEELVNVASVVHPASR